MPRLLTVLLNYKTAEMTLQSAQAALREMQGLDAELVIVDNDSQDGSFETMSDTVKGWDAPVRVIDAGRNGGFGAGNNVGIRAGLSDGSKPDYVYILNSDAFVQEGAIRILMDHLEAHPQVGFAGSYIYGDADGPHVSAFRFPTAFGELEGAARTGPITRLLKKHVVPMPIPQQTCTVDWLAGASMMMRRDVLDDIGLFDETFFLYFEETDLSLRANRAGWPTQYVRESAVMHIGSVSTGMRKWNRIPGYWLDSHWHYYTKNHGLPYAIAATLSRLLGEGLWTLRRTLPRKPPTGPDRFARDIAAHHLRALLRPASKPSLRPTARLSEVE